MHRPDHRIFQSDSDSRPLCAGRSHELGRPGDSKQDSTASASQPTREAGAASSSLHTLPRRRGGRPDAENLPLAGAPPNGGASLPDWTLLHCPCRPLPTCPEPPSPSRGLQANEATEPRPCPEKQGRRRSPLTGWRLVTAARAVATSGLTLLILHPPAPPVPVPHSGQGDNAERQPPPAWALRGLSAVLPPPPRAGDRGARAPHSAFEGTLWWQLPAPQPSLASQAGS
ncbi:hypothetical protein E2I00_010722 [Balaenoptera physalus]|uniref:Uncharacterized protein n=1 Tax=Balaenoptera physalus TaxID=9770 RepID=A0A643BZ93_BALPH|nr:hypothetical protein E2I00_010722 [Balaenoptera physalus]